MEPGQGRLDELLLQLQAKPGDGRQGDGRRRKTRTTAGSCSRTWPKLERWPRPLGRRSSCPKDAEEHCSKHKARLKSHKDGRLVMHIRKRPGEKNKTLHGWIGKPDKWVKMFDVLTETKQDDIYHAEYDTLIRQLVSPSKEDAGWFLRAEDESWQRFNRESEATFDFARSPQASS